MHSFQRVFDSPFSIFRRCSLWSALFGALLAVPSATSFASARSEMKRPNVLLIFTDDQGSVDLNCYGAKDLFTPHLDALAKRGVRFTQFYAAAPVCSPSRAGLMTGRYPQRAGVPGNVSSQKGNDGMPTEQITIAEMMKAAGYVTGHVGKWHLGYTPKTMPNGQGFDESFGHMGGCIDNYSHFFYWNGPNRHDLWRNGTEVWNDGEFFPDLMVKDCNRFLEKHASRPRTDAPRRNKATARPFFLYWAINVPHYPLQGTDKWRKKYAKLSPPRSKYAAFVSTMDEKIGEVLATLDRLKLRENTIVIFQSDHGHSTETRTFGGGGSAGPYRGAKFSLFEGGIRVPAIISWPGHIPENEVRDQLATGCDWMPTIAELCGLKPPRHKIDGKSIVGLLKSKTAPSPHKVFHWQTGRRKRPQWAIREGNWKLIGNPRDTGSNVPLRPSDRLFLVDLSQDVGEKNNIAAKHPKVVERLRALHNDWVKSFAKTQ